jgi:hypothetical protein
LNATTLQFYYKKSAIIFLKYELKNNQAFFGGSPIAIGLFNRVNYNIFDQPILDSFSTCRVETPFAKISFILYNKD